MPRDVAEFQHSHNFVHDFSRAEARTRVVIGITFVMMVAEIVFGWLSNSMALLAEGWHMSTHVLAFMMAAVAYHFTRRHSNDARFSFGTGKIGVLAGYSSAIVLGIVAIGMATESVHRFFSPLAIAFNEAIGIAALGLCVNLICAWLFRGESHHHHDAHEHEHDLNLRSAYLHVLADAFTGVLAVAALTCGKFFGRNWLDPAVAIVASAVVFVWACRLMRDSSTVLLDITPATSDLPTEIRCAVESDGDSRVTDLHVWQVSSGRFAAIVSILAREPLNSDEIRARLSEHDELVHLTIEIQNADEPARFVLAAPQRG